MSSLASVLPLKMFNVEGEIEDKDTFLTGFVNPSSFTVFNIEFQTASQYRGGSLMAVPQFERLSNRFTSNFHLMKYFLYNVMVYLALMNFFKGRSVARLNSYCEFTICNRNVVDLR